MTVCLIRIRLVCERKSAVNFRRIESLLKNCSIFLQKERWCQKTGKMLPEQEKCYQFQMKLAAFFSAKNEWCQKMGEVTSKSVEWRQKWWHFFHREK